MVPEVGEVLEALPYPVWALDSVGNCTFQNRRWTEHTGMDAARSRGRGWLDAIHPADVVRLPPLWNDPGRSAVHRITVRVLRPDGTAVPSDVHLARAADPGGRGPTWWAMAFEHQEPPRRERGPLVAAGPAPSPWERPAPAFFVEPSFVMSFVNQEARDYLGGAGRQPDGQPITAALHPLDRQRFSRKLRQLLATGADWQGEYRFRRHDGSHRWAHVRMTPSLDGHGAVAGYRCLLTDVNDLKRAEALLAGEVRLLEMVARGHGLLEVLDALSRLVEELSEGCFCSILIVAPDRSHFTVGGGPSLPDSYNAILNGKTIDGGYGPCSLAVIGRAPVISSDIANDPRWKASVWPALMESYGYASCWSMPILTGSGEASGIFAIYRRDPVSPTPEEQELIDRFTKIAGIAIDRAQADEALKASEGDLRRAHAQLAEGQRLSKTGSFTADIQLDRHRWSDEFYRIFEIDPGAPPGVQAVRDRVLPDDLPLFDREMERALAGLGADFTFRIMTPGAGLKHIRGLARVIEHVDGRPIFMGTIQDITDTKMAEDAVRASEAEVRRSNHFLAAAQTLSKTGSFTWNLDTGERQWSDEMYRILDLDPQAPLPSAIMDFVLPDDRALGAALVERALQGHAFQGGFRIVSAHGTEKCLHVVGHPMPDADGGRTFVGAVQDVTELKRGQDALNQVRAELAHVSRVTMLSALAASIAHEVSQPLSGILTNANTCLRLLAADPPDLAGAAATARRTIRDTDRASEVIKRLRALFGRKEAASEQLDINDAIRDVLALSAAELQRQKVKVQASLDEGVPLLRGDRVQLQQVVMNLVLNAADAMSATAGQRILTVSSALGEHGTVLVSVRDVGCGIDPALAERIFDPFYTTKADGMGIGLAISRSIIEAHDGRLWAAAHDGPGTIIRFELPVGAGQPVRVAGAQGGRVAMRRAEGGGAA